ncbi:MAG: hypothetical protein M9962_11135 [Oligoflexia bacterium]|nr:hypothetical protein [Oligoflexia bacterium]
MHTKHEIYRGREINKELSQLRICGYAFKSNCQKYYKLNLMLFPGITYYLTKNKDIGFTIFSKMIVKEDGSELFQNPVGYGKLLDHVRTHLYLRFPDLGSHMYMSLFPKE